MRKPVIAGNWKMNGARSATSDLLSTLSASIAEIPDIEMIVFPPYVFLEQVQRELAGGGIAWGAQNVYEREDGAFTGETSINMLKEFGCSYVIVGHSERRHIMGETNEQVAQKFVLAGKNGIKPILCVGETQKEREDGKTLDIINQQLSPILNDQDAKQILNEAIIAYEPVWAIGTGLTATPAQAQEVHQYIRQVLSNINKNLAENVRIIYGGSVKQNNARALFSMPDIDGGLIGGASLNAKEFLEIAKLCH